MKDFAGRTAFVTGGANGIGIGVVRALLAEGCRVAMADIRAESIDKALRALDNPKCMGVQVDVSSRQDMQRAAAEVEAKFGPVSVLFNNAGINLFQTAEESSFDDWDWVLGVNLHGPINGVMTFVPGMVKAGKGGYIVNTASMAAFLAAGVPAIYNTTKFAVRGLSESLRASLAPHGIGVSVLCPGLVKSYIYASNDIRPERLKHEAKPVDAANVKRLADIHEFGMEPDVIAARVLEAMRENRFHIFTHPEFKDELSELFSEVLQDFRDYPHDSGFEQRTGFEKTRRESYKKQRRGLKG
ncbi:MAG TPA: SDR family NAD(P)-dependent oxidoreductase [Steroidobacteraceae bacterium]|jgi:NAD(P)-dependent dehydrogenase (short-subunit alcohol dehydrogenase family)